MNTTCFYRWRLCGKIFAFSFCAILAFVVSNYFNVSCCGFSLSSLKLQMVSYSNPLKITTLHNYWLGSNFLVLFFRMFWCLKFQEMKCILFKVQNYNVWKIWSLTYVRSKPTTCTYLLLWNKSCHESKTKYVSISRSFNYIILFSK